MNAHLSQAELKARRSRQLHMARLAKAPTQVAKAFIVWGRARAIFKRGDPVINERFARRLVETVTLLSDDADRDYARGGQQR